VGLSNFLRTVGGSISTAVCVWLWTKRTDTHHAVLAQYIQGPNWSSYLEQLRALGISGVNAFNHARAEMLLQARTLAANDLYRAFGYLFWLLAPMVWFARPPFRAPGGGGGGAH
jgi:DHA2 family multidrug resistance protein